MMQRILVAIDGSKQSEKALLAATEEALVHGAELHAVFVRFPVNVNTFPADFAFGSLDTTPGISYEVVTELLENEAASIIDRAVSLAGAEGVDLVMHQCTGDARTEIIRLAEAIGADLIVVGSTGKSGIDRLLIGSVSSAVVERSSISTLVIR